MQSRIYRGGVERQMIALARGLIARGFAVDVFALWKTPAPTSFEPEFRECGVCPTWPSNIVADREEERAGRAMSEFALRHAVIFEPYPEIEPHRITALCSAIAATINRSRPDVVHGWSHISNVLIGSAARHLQIPRLVFGFRNLPPPARYDARVAEAYLRAYRELLDDKVALVANGAAIAAACQDWLGARHSVEVIYNGFAGSSIGSAAGEKEGGYRQELGVPDSGFLIGGIMRFTAEKDVDLWLDTVALIAERERNAHFVLAGHGPDAAVKHICRKANFLGLRDRLALPGVATDVGRIYRALDAFLLSSRIEGTPNVLIEAQAAGIPVVATAVGAVAETVCDGMSGLLVRERSAHALADAVLKILGERRWRQRAKMCGPTFVADRFDLDRMVSQTIAMYGVVSMPAHARQRAVSARPAEAGASVTQALLYPAAAKMR